MRDFLAAPFLFIANFTLWAGAMIQDKNYILLEISDEDIEELNDE